MAFFTDQLKQVFRRLVRAPLFTTITLITLAVGIGANTVVFSVVEGVLLKPLSYPQADRLIGIWHLAPGIGFDDLNMAPFLYFIDREQSTTLEDVGMYNGDSLLRHRRGSSQSTCRAWTSPMGRLPAARRQARPRPPLHAP